MSRRCIAVTVAALVFALGATGARGDTAGDVTELLRRGDAAVALQRVDAVLQSAPNDVSLRFLRGVALMDLQRDDAAIAAFGDLAHEYPELAEPYNNLALLHARAGRLEAARTDLMTALRNDPDHREARINLGRVHLALAEQAWRQALESDARAGVAPDPALRQRLDAVRAIVDATTTAPRPR